jgi:tape measure domain-containing protein
MADGDVIIRVVETGAKEAAANIAAIGNAAGTSATQIDELTKQTAKAEAGNVTFGKRVSENNVSLDKNGELVKKAAVETAKSTEATTKQAAALASLERAAGRVGSVIGSLVGSLVGLGALGVAAGILNIGQQSENAAIRLQGLTAATRDYATVLPLIKASANDNRLALDGLVSSFGLLRTSTTFANTSSAALVNTATLVSIAMRNAGNSAATTSAGIQSFTQALATGNISGEKFAEIYAQFPTLGNAIAQGLGRSVETLKVLGVTSADVARGLQNMSGELKATNNQTVSVADAFNDLSSAFKKYVTSSDEATGANKLLAAGIKFVADNLDTILNVLLGAAGVVVGIKAFTAALGAAKFAQDLFALSTRTGPLAVLGALVTALGLAIEAYRRYKNATDEAANADKNAAAAREQSQSQMRAQANREYNTRMANMPRQESNEVRDSQRAFDSSSNSFNLNDLEARASGGPVKANNQYIVGEEGPELFVPKVSGSIIPNGGGASPINSSAAGSSFSAKRAQDLLTEAVRDGVKTDLDAIKAAIDKTNELLAGIVSSAASGGGAGGAAGGNALIPGMSAINNFGGDPAPVPAAPTAAPSDFPTAAPLGASGGGGGGGNALDTNVDYWTGVYTQALDKQRREALVTGNRDAHLGDLKKAYDAIPEQIRNEVVGKAGAKVYGVGGGASVAFRTGGTARVAGSGGADSKLVGMRVTPGELVDVKTRRQADAEKREKGGDTYITVEMNIQTPDANSFRRTEKQTYRELLNALAKATE